MSQHDHRALLQRLIIAAESMLRGCREDRDQIDELRVAIARECATPTDLARVMDAHTSVAADAVAHCNAALQRFERNGAARWQRVIGCLLPDIRDDLATAIEQSRRPTP